MTSLGFPGCHPSPFQGFLALVGQKTPKRTGMTSLGFLGLSSQSVSGVFWPLSARKPCDKPGLPRVVIPIHFGFLLALFGQKSPKRTGMTSLGFPGLSSKSVSVFLAFFGQKTPKRTGMTSLGFPGLSSQSVSRFFCPFRQENPEMDWDDKPGLPRVVIPVHFGFFWHFSARKPRNGF